MTKNDAVERAVTALTECKEIFELYVTLHNQKGTDDGRLKAMANQAHADMVSEALLALQTSRPDADREKALDWFDLLVKHTFPDGAPSSQELIETIRAALKSGDKGRDDDRENLLKIIAVQKDYLKAYKDGKYAMYSMSEEIRDAAIKNLPCGEGPLDRAVSAALRVPPTSEGV